MNLKLQESLRVNLCKSESRGLSWANGGQKRAPFTLPHRVDFSDILQRDSQLVGMVLQGFNK